MRLLPQLFENNRAWAARVREDDREAFTRQGAGQAPSCLWVGCSDSRVPAETIVGVAPGELFVHRNVANLMSADDLNSQAVLEFAVDGLGVEHVIVCGHYGCGGVRAALDGGAPPRVEAWVAPLAAEAEAQAESLKGLDDDGRWRKLCELNVAHQVAQVVRSSTLKGAWKRDQDLAVHGWIYDPATGLLQDLALTVDR